MIGYVYGAVITVGGLVVASQASLVSGWLMMIGCVFAVIGVGMVIGEWCRVPERADRLADAVSLYEWNDK